MEAIKINVDINKTFLSSESSLFKTENFIKQTKYISNIDFFVSKIAESIQKNFFLFEKELTNYYDISINNDLFTISFSFGKKILNCIEKDLIFFNFSSTKKEIRQNDQSLNDFLQNKNLFEVIISPTTNLININEFNKLYLLTNSSNINLPKLNFVQKEIVETINQNVLVQGVAGSGKTNVCIEKIIFSACKSYSGKILYSTFSRGLLIDTKQKVITFKKELQDFVEDFKKNQVIFLDSNQKKALENKFGIYFSDDDTEINIKKIEEIIYYLENKVDYLLIEDIYKNKTHSQKKFVNEDFFINVYLKNIKNHQLSKNIYKLERHSFEVIYKEIFGMIFGKCNDKDNQKIISENNYIELRKQSFSKEDCQIIYSIAKNYLEYLKTNSLINNNVASRELLKENIFEEYSLCILDEVQDFCEVSLCLFKQLSIKLFCVGDALQMINPSFFSFAYLKNLLFDEELYKIKELKSNYRNTKKIEDIVNSLCEVQKNYFGTHNFVIKGQSIESGQKTNAIYVNSQSFIKKIAENSFDNFTFVVSNLKQKDNLKKIIKNQEILTVSEIKGLERNTIVTYNLLSDNISKWNNLLQIKLNHKQADENSVYRYYYNLFYVGLTRAKQNLFVIENQKLKSFEQFFNDNFDKCNDFEAIKTLTNIVSKLEYTEKELLERIKEFIKLEQYDNASFTANKIRDDIKRIEQLNIIEVNKTFIRFGNYREAGIKFWELGLLDEAKKQFELSNDEQLIKLLEACSENNNSKLNIDIVDYIPYLENNSTAKNLVIDTIKKDIENLKQSFKEINKNIKKVEK